MSGAIVFVTQIPNRRDHATGAMLPAFNIAPAVEHGTIEQVMPPSASFFNTVEMVKHMRLKLGEYNYERGDSVVCSGDPIVIAAAGAILAERNRNLRLLKWDRNVGRYVPVEVHL